MAKFTVCFARTQYASIEVEAEDSIDALDKADDYYDEHFEEIDRMLCESSGEYEKFICD